MYSSREWETPPEERRLEIENRLRNLFWTVSGDYTLTFHPDVDTFALAPALALYDAAYQGAFARCFDREKLARYLLRKLDGGADPGILTELTGLCVDEAAYAAICREREGVRELRQQAFRELLEIGDFQTPLGRLHRSLLLRFLGEPENDAPAEILRAAQTIEALSHGADTDAVIAVVDRLYATAPGMEKARQAAKLPDYRRDMALSDERMQRVLEAYAAQLKDALRAKILPSARRPLMPQQAREQLPEPSPEEAEKVYGFMERQFGKSYLSRREQQKISRQFCTGIHGRCQLYFTAGILTNPAVKNTQFLRTQMQSMKNEMYFTMKQQAIRRSVQVLTAMLKQAQIQRMDEDSARSDAGQIVPARLWKVGRTRDRKLFDRREKRDGAVFAVDILIDGSGSQTLRQPQIAAQSYIVSRALSEAGIPHRVSGFCSYWDYTVIHRFRDYDDGPESDKNVLSFRAFGENRDGLALRAVCDGLLERREERKILIFLSDGRPNHLGAARPGCWNPAPYVGEAAVKDTAGQVRRARNQGLCVLGIFVGGEEELYAEKRIFGREFIYTRSISSFAHIVGNYLRRQIESE